MSAKRVSAPATLIDRAMRLVAGWFDSARDLNVETFRP